MAYITRKQIKGTTYYYAEESERINGKTRRKWQKYLGPLHKIMAAMDGLPSNPQYAEIFELGCPAAYLKIVQEFKMIKILDDIFHKRSQGLSTGFYLGLAAINRGIQSVSKRSMWDWYKNTILLRSFPEVDKKSLSSQRFWDNMSTISENKIKRAWMNLINSVLEQEKIDLSSVSYDGTNFYSFIHSFNTRCSLAQRGKNKQGRGDLKQINYALFCTRQEHFPLYFDVYEGNRHDSKAFEGVIDNFFNAFSNRVFSEKGMTIVFDKGNNSDTNFKRFITDSGFHFVGSVKLDDHKELAMISNDDDSLKPLSHPRLDQVKAFRTQKKMYGKTLTVIVTFNNSLYSSQLQSINNEVNKCVEKLSLLSLKLENRIAGIVTKGRKPTKDSVRKQIASIRSGQHMKKLISVDLTECNGIPRISYHLDNAVFAELCDTYLGKNIIITDNAHWATEEIIVSYRSQYIVEDIFKQMKDRKTGSWWPMFHWTDQMIRVHGLYCSITLLIRALMMKRIQNAGISMSINKTQEKLSEIREVINVFPQKRKKKISQSVVSKMDETQKRLFEIFEMESFLSN
ncbi:IS1634 family transposase [Desulfobacter latus]|uniref:IS1634 family transposase n=1 Tax=Desulfobacter latus TaxID=2292 RepID=A0A850SQ15_9BACT|nr:IS1634 family transposase [Desulfobacter latus]NWH03564.1 IS1634 family transposase [Desulfobacter latus]